VVALSDCKARHQATLDWVATAQRPLIGGVHVIVSFSKDVQIAIAAVVCVQSKRRLVVKSALEAVAKTYDTFGANISNIEFLADPVRYA
jgi:uncharacterized membrane protein AbrB (regulator of aidB expression)